VPKPDAAPAVSWAGLTAFSLEGAPLVIGWRPAAKRALWEGPDAHERCNPNPAAQPPRSVGKTKEAAGKFTQNEVPRAEGEAGLAAACGRMGG
jgi:hypothetical protein